MVLDEVEKKVYRRRYESARAGAIKRGLSFNLSEREYFHLTQIPCSYCGAPPGNPLYLYGSIRVGPRGNRRAVSVRVELGLKIGGIDRRDSGVGYEFDNCVPCCWPCNGYKGSMPWTDWAARSLESAAVVSMVLPEVEPVIVFW